MEEKKKKEAEIEICFLSTISQFVSAPQCNIPDHKLNTFETGQSSQSHQLRQRIGFHFYFIATESYFRKKNKQSK